MFHDKATYFLTFCLIFSKFQKFTSGFECKHDNFDLSPLNGTWISWTDDTAKQNISFKISLCSPLVPNGADDHTCPSGASICMIYSNGTAYSAGNFKADASSLSGGRNDKLGETWIVLAGDTCPTQSSYNLTTSINFKCGPTIGSPVFLDFTPCVTYFEWESDVFCTTKSAKKEVPCYLYDDKGNRYDLSPLAKTKGGYLVSSEDPETNVFINVCRDIAPDSITTGCPDGAASCRKSGHDTIGLGEVTEGLKRGTNGLLTLKYVSPQLDTTTGCTTKPSTTIIFMCPERGASKFPIIVSDFDCQYVIEWETEYACVEARLSNTSCVLTKEDADIDIDLRPLIRKSGNPYKVSLDDTSSNTVYDFFLNVCGDIGIPCPDEDHMDRIAACQTKQHASNFGWALGKTDRMKLSYADNQLTLTNKGGDKCNATNNQRQTVINFICNQTAGEGSPKFQTEDNCVFMFTWQTKYACLDHPSDESCRIESNGKKYDLGVLSRKSGTNNMALHEQNDLYGRGTYFINVCHNVLQTGDATRCDPSAAICYREGLKTKNLGRYENKPTLDSRTNNTVIKYTNGDVCQGSTTRITSTITFICKPGEAESAPALSQVSDDKCFYDFEWRTSAACALGHYTGTDCKIFGEGVSFDLTPLKKSAGYYTVNSTADPHHEYYINVCGPVTGTECDKSDIKNVGICQEPYNQNGDSFVAGQWTSNLHYYDELITLTYSGGTPYHDEKHTPRKSEIAFLCDPAAGIGKPTYLQEAASDHYYSFEWRTSYACPVEALQCTAVDTIRGQEYDISSLTMLGDNNWAAAGSYNTKYYINVCQPLNRVAIGMGCDPSAAICRTKIENGKEVLDIPNMGRMASSLQVIDEGSLRLTYRGGSCNNGTANIAYLINLQFMCRHTALSSPPSIPLQDGPCEFTILWDTPAACPLQKDKDIQPCTAKDPNTGYVFNLTPLTKQDEYPYSIAVDGTTYKLNICGNISESVCPKTDDGTLSGVCQVEADGTKTSIAGAKSALDFSEVGVMSLVYDGIRLGSGQRVNAKILFMCSPDKDLGSPTFSRKEGNTYIFMFFTALACTPTSMDCLVQDDAGKEYDLSPLIKPGHWTATDTRDTDTTYYLNVCAAVQNVTNSKCIVGPIGGCQVASNGHSYNMGYVQAKPIAVSDGTVTIHYRNGDVCHKGTPNEATRSTRLTFFCAQTEGGPVFVSETQTCEYLFEWRTPAACPLQSKTGEDCKVTEPLYNTLFDMNKLRAADHKVTVDGFEYLINVCGPLVQSNSCGTGTGAGVCQTKPQDSNFQPVNIGKGSKRLLYSGGQLMLNYTDGDNNCNTLIKFSCDLGPGSTAGPQFVEKSAGKCQYVFDWPTTYACATYKSATCHVQDREGHVIDLTDLGLLNDNYEVTDTIEKKRYVLNVCRSVIPGPNSTCPHNAAACMIDLEKPADSQDRYKSIGEPNGYQMRYEGGHVIIAYDHGDKCDVGDGDMTTHITFTCDRTATTSNPTGHFMIGACDHHFLWTSAAACPREDSGDAGGKVVTPANITCRVSDPVTGSTFDLSNLRTTDKGSPYSVTDKQGHKYEFNICGPVHNSACTDKSSAMGVCQTAPNEPSSKQYNAGNVVHDLWFDDGIVIQNLTGGDRCHDGRFQRNTIISFVCNEHRGLGRPTFIDETEDCTYYISWHTSVVCRQEMKCSVDTNDYRTIDLSPLVDNPDDVVHSSEDGSIFYLSVCSALTPAAGVLCPAGSGVCQVKPEDGIKHTSLGKPKSPLTYDSKTGDVTLQYVNGSQCDIDPTKTFSARVIFSCLPGPIRSSPVFVSKSLCEYVFHWDTYLVCKEAPDDVCGYHDTSTGDFYDFKKLQQNTPVEVMENGQTKYLIQMCGGITSDDTSSCNSHMVCRKEDGVSFGEPSNYEVVKEGRYIKMKYDTSVGKCPDNKMAQSSIHFVCDRNVGSDSAPIVLASMDCDVVFEWKTNVVCPTIENPCSIVIDNHLYDLSVLSKQHGAWNVTDRNKNTYYINICTAVGGSNLPAICDQTSAACRKPSNGDWDVIGLITAQKKLYKDTAKDALVLEYDDGSPCSEKRDLTASTKINFICGSTFGAPEFVDSDENKKQCIYEFNWKTKIACEVERETMVVSNGQLKDKQTGLVVDLRPIWNKSFMVNEELDSGTKNVYQILLNGNSTNCKDGVVCKIDNDRHTNRILGKYSSANFSMDDWIVEATYITSEKCSGGNSNVTSVIQFICSKLDFDPKLLYRKDDCFYMFTWETQTACSIAAHLVPSVTSSTGNQAGQPGSKHSSGKSGVSTSTVVGIVATFLAAIVLCILLVVFHKQERREACFHRLRGMFPRGRSEYSQLPTGSIDDVLGDEEEVVTVENAAGDSDTEEPILSVTTTPTSYHDDSDEDLLA